MTKHTQWLIIAGFLALLLGITARNVATSIASPAAQQIPLTEFTLKDLSGQIHSINEWQDKVRIINFWATWCPPCLKEMPEFNEIQKKYADKDIQFIGIALDDLEPVKKFITTNKISYPILLGGDQGIKLAHSLGNIVDAVPFTVIIDKNGQIVKVYMGEVSSDELIKGIMSSKT